MERVHEVVEVEQEEADGMRKARTEVRNLGGGSWVGCVCGVVEVWGAVAGGFRDMGA